jgi:hypothetical protein
MPKLAKTDKEQCCAFDKTDHRRCRLMREQDKLTCKIHKLYYADWLYNHPPLTNVQMTPRKTEEYSFQLKNGYASIPATVLWFLTSPAFFETYSDYILLLLNNTDLSLAKYPDYVHYLVNTHIGRNINLPIEDQMVRWQVLLPYLKDAETMHLFLDAVVECLINQAFMALNQIHLSIIFSTIINGPLPWSLLLYSERVNDVSERVFQAYSTKYVLNQEQRTFIQNFLRDRIAIPLDHFHHSHRFLTRRKCHQIKEEIMMNVFHPRRIEKLINTYDIDIIDELWG